MGWVAIGVEVELSSVRGQALTIKSAPDELETVGLFRQPIFDQVANLERPGLLGDNLAH